MAYEYLLLNNVSRKREKDMDLKFLYSETSIYPSWMYRMLGSIVQFLWSLNKTYLNYRNKTRINRSSIYGFPASIGQNF
jgi:hypothetical protein